MENNNNLHEGSKQQDAAFQVRIDEYWINKFDDLLQETYRGSAPKGAKKVMLESILAYYMDGKKKEDDEKTLAFNSDIRLISENLNTILSTIKSMTRKAQNTVASEKNLAAQTIENLERDLERKKIRIEALENRNAELENTNNVFNAVKESMENRIIELELTLKNEREGHSQALQSANNDIKDLKLQYGDLLKENKALKQFEDENSKLKEKLESEKTSVKVLNESMLIKDNKITDLENKINELHAEVKSVQSNKNKDIDDMKKILEEKLSVEKEKAVIAVEKEFNKLQVELIKVMGIINAKDSEIDRLNKELESKQVGEVKQQ